MAGEQGKKFGAWVSSAISSGTSTSAINLGLPFQKVLVLVPTISSATVAVSVAMATGGDYFPVYQLKGENTGDTLYTTNATTATKAVIFDIGGAQFIKVVFSATQTTKTVYVRGFNP